MSEAPRQYNRRETGDRRDFGDRRQNSGQQYTTSPQPMVPHGQEYYAPQGNYQGAQDQPPPRRRITNPPPTGVRQPGSRHGYSRPDFGSWKQGDPIPGKTTKDGAYPDMRDRVNRFAFLNETYDQRVERTAGNLQRGREVRQNMVRQNQDWGYGQGNIAIGGSQGNLVSLFDEITEMSTRDLAELQAVVNQEMSRREQGQGYNQQDEGNIDPRSLPPRMGRNSENYGGDYGRRGR